MVRPHLFRTEFLGEMIYGYLTASFIKFLKRIGPESEGDEVSRFDTL